MSNLIYLITSSINLNKFKNFALKLLAIFINFIYNFCILILGVNLMKKIAILGGSFDPVHNGHIQIIKSIKEDLAIDEVIVIPTGENPIKGKRTDKNHRFLMTKNSLTGCIVSDIEITREGPSFSYITMEILKKENPDSEFFFAIGTDILEELPHWEGFDELKNLVTFLILSRPGFPLKLPPAINYRVLKLPLLEISSTKIRGLVSDGKDYSHLVPSFVKTYIEENNLYKFVASKDYIYEKLKNLSAKRYKHVFGVVDEAIMLAKHYNINIEKAEMAALYHDVAKEYSSEEIESHIEKYDTKLPFLLYTQPKLVHGFLAADLAYEQGIKDEDVLNAMRYHTIGRKGMSMLEKIIYIADAFEPNRTFNEREELKNLAYEDINKAIHWQLSYLINIRSGEFIHPNCFLLMQDLKEVYGIS